MPVFRFDKAFGIARDAKAFLNRATREDRATRDAAPDAEQRGEQAEYRKKIKSKRQELRQKRQEVRQVKKDEKDELRAKKQHSGGTEYKKRKKRVQQEIFQLERELLRLEGELDTEEERTKGAPAGDPETGALPDFVVIGTKKGGTSFLYHLLTLHPYVEPAAKKELHYFDALFDEEGVDWYRRCFPPPRWKDGRRTITGEATPYLGHPPAPERMAEVVPQARLIALLRNPVDRAYSDYQMGVRKGRETRTFEEAIEEAIELEKTLPLGKEDNASEHEDRANLDDGACYGYLSRGIYVDQLLHWSKYFGDEQVLVLKSEDFFERPAETLKPVLDFLGLPDWEPEASEIVPKRRNEGHYEQGMDPAIRRRLEEFFEPHNERLYEYLGQDFGW